MILLERLLFYLVFSILASMQTEPLIANPEFCQFFLHFLLLSIAPHAFFSYWQTGFVLFPQLYQSFSLLLVSLVCFHHCLCTSTFIDTSCGKTPPNQIKFLRTPFNESYVYLTFILFISSHCHFMILTLYHSNLDVKTASYLVSKFLYFPVSVYINKLSHSFFNIAQTTTTKKLSEVPQMHVHLVSLLLVFAQTPPSSLSLLGELSLFSGVSSYSTSSGQVFLVFVASSPGNNWVLCLTSVKT